MKVISLFAGIGGFDLGFEQAGMETVAQVEMNPNCRQLLAAKFPHAARFEDVKDVGAQQLPEADIVTAGWPCQDISLAGLQAGLEGGARSKLFYEYIRIITECRPLFTVFENVESLRSSDQKRDFPHVLAALAECGY